jgi:hypothetical protein
VIPRIVLIVAVTGCRLEAHDCTRRIAEDFVPMSTSQRLVHAFDSVARPGAALSVGIRAGIDYGANRQPEWGRGADRFALRYSNVYAEHFIAQVIEQSTAFVRHEDNRYFASGARGLSRRLGYAAASAVLARRDDGSRTISYSALGGAAGAAFISRRWQARGNSSAGDAAVSFGITMGIRAGFNLIREFAPRGVGAILR